MPLKFTSTTSASVGAAVSDSTSVAYERAVLRRNARRIGSRLLALSAALLFFLPAGLSTDTSGSHGASWASTQLAHAAVTSATWNGRYVYTGGDGERELLRHAIDRTVASLRAISRGVARARLLHVAQPYDALRLEVTEGEIAVGLGGHSVVSPRDGSAVRATTPNGTRASVRQQISGRDLVQVLHTRSGTRRNQFHLSADGSRLEARANIASERLPEDLNYVFTYRRVR